MDPALSYYQAALDTYEYCPTITRVVHPRKVHETHPGHFELMNESFSSDMHKQLFGRSRFPAFQPNLLRQQEMNATHFDYLHDPNAYRKNQIIGKARHYEAQGQVAEARMEQYMKDSRQLAINQVQSDRAKQVQFKEMLKHQQFLEKLEEKQKQEFMNNYFKEVEYAQHLKKLRDQRHLRDVYHQQIKFNRAQRQSEGFPALDETYARLRRYSPLAMNGTNILA